MNFRKSIFPHTICLYLFQFLAYKVISIFTTHPFLPFCLPGHKWKCGSRLLTTWMLLWRGGKTDEGRRASSHTLLKTCLHLLRRHIFFFYFDVCISPLFPHTPKVAYVNTRKRNETVNEKKKSGQRKQGKLTSVETRIGIGHSVHLSILYSFSR